MTGRIVTLNAAKGGINRLKVKGGADANTLYDLVNGFVDAAGVINSRPSTRGKVSLPPGTKGMCVYDGKLVVFSGTPKPMPITSPQVECEVLNHPTSPGLDIFYIHFAKPHMGYLYVAAEFVNGDVFHYWLQRGTTWEPNKAYLPGALVMPTNSNGIAYQLDSGTESFVAWLKNVSRNVGDVIVPTEDDGFKYTVTDAFGPSPKSGAIEPTWPAVDGGTVFEDSDVAVPAPISSGQSGTTLPPSVSDRYGTGQAGTNEVTR